MTILRDGFLAFVSAVGVATLVWLLAGPLLRAGRSPAPGLLLVLPVRGEALALENDMRELRRLQSQVPKSRIILVDCGLTRDAWELANYLADREKNAAVVKEEEFWVD